LLLYRGAASPILGGDNASIQCRRCPATRLVRNEGGGVPVTGSLARVYESRHLYPIGDANAMLMQPRLLAVEGPLRGRTFNLGEDDIAIGRVTGSSIVIDHKSVSRRHCVFRKNGDSFRLVDENSRNGTVVNGQPVGECLLNHGDRIDVGSSSFIFLEQEEDLASLLGDVRLTDDAFDSDASVELRQEDTCYFHPETVFGGAGDERRLRDFGSILQLGAALQSAPRLEQLEEQALHLIMEVIPAGAGAILLTGSRPDQFLSTYGRMRSGSETVPVSRSVVAHVLNGRKALLTNDAQGAMPGNETVIRSAARSLLCVPLVSGERAFGVIYLSSAAGQPGFDESHLQVLTAMAAMLALPLEAARRVDWLETENQRLHQHIDADYRMIGDSPPMKAIYKFIARVGSSDSTVLIRGESGTGKELIARALHRASRRADAPFVAINCAVLKGDLIESDLFGHEKGAFTSAIAQKKGKFEIADGGTIFLDEIAELPPELQVKLLRVLQEREFERIGGTRPIKVDVRVLAATNRDIEEAMREGKFRQELYYRLHVVSMESPPLRQRTEDIPVLARYFAARYASRYNSPIRGISAEAEACLSRYSWPGNVRELQNAVERAVVLGESDMLLPEDLPESIVEARGSSPTFPLRFHDAVRETKRRLIEEALEQTSGNHAEAARLLGINRTYLHRLIRNLELESKS
jgi:transcriptional regulator with GAF, ATPase, and Fis domain/pSer/pThr/pTyr-binding forkhead associated (FHA) protein